MRKRGKAQCLKVASGRVTQSETRDQISFPSELYPTHLAGMTVHCGFHCFVLIISLEVQLTTQIMRYLHIYLAALGTLSPTHAISHGAAQLRDLLAYPKYDVQFLNDLPLSHSDAEQAKTMGVETEDEWFDIKLQTRDRRRLGDGNDTPPAEVGRFTLTK